MFQNSDQKTREMADLAALGSDAVAYMREITSEEIIAAFPETQELEMGQKYWALFSADGSPLVLAHSQQDISSSAFYNNLEAVLPN